MSSLQVQKKRFDGLFQLPRDSELQKQKKKQVGIRCIAGECKETTTSHDELPRHVAGGALCE